MLTDIVYASVSIKSEKFTKVLRARNSRMRASSYEISQVEVKPECDFRVRRGGRSSKSFRSFVLLGKRARVFVRQMFIQYVELISSDTSS